MKKVLAFFTILTMISAPLTVVSCGRFETRDRTKISLALFKSELALVPVFERQNNPTKVVTETMFQDAIYGALEINQFRGDIASNELKFIYYNQDLTAIPWTDLPWQSLTSGDEKTTLLWVQIIANSNSSHFTNGTDIIATTLYKTQPLALDTIKFNYEEQTLKRLSIDEMMTYFGILNPTFYFSSRHLTISKSAAGVVIKAMATSERYRGENIINFTDLNFNNFFVKIKI